MELTTESPTWDQVGINLAHEIAKKSKDPSSKVGCYISTASHEPVSLGFNGMVKKANEAHFTYTDRKMKYLTIIHAEMNAVLFADRDKLVGATAYITHGPCENCLKHMAQAGIVRVIYSDPGIMRDRSTPEQKEAIRQLIAATGIAVFNINGFRYWYDLTQVESEKN